MFTSIKELFHAGNSSEFAQMFDYWIAGKSNLGIEFL